MATDAARIRRIDWPIAGRHPRGSLLFLPGRADCYEKYLESFADWHHAGWHVTSVDWRGQAGSGRLGRDARIGHIDDFAQWVADLAEFWRNFRVNTAGPHVLIGHSMGGHLALRALAEGVINPVTMVLTSPMLGMAVWGLPSRILHCAARIMARLGSRQRPAWRHSEKPGASLARRDALLTHDMGRYDDELWWHRVRPELAMGPGSWGWVECALASQCRMEVPGVLEAIMTPVQILAARADRLVSWRAEYRAARRLPHGELISFGPEACHELLRESDPVRDACLAAIDDFLGRTAPMENGDA